MVHIGQVVVVVDMMVYSVVEEVVEKDSKLGAGKLRVVGKELDWVDIHDELEDDYCIVVDIEFERAVELDCS